MKPKFLLLYSPQIFDKSFGAIKPEGSLGLMYLAGALRDKNYDVTILDATVGNNKYTLEETFYNEVKLSDGMIRVGMNIEDILKEVEDYDVIGLSSIFTAQTRMVKEVVQAIKNIYPKKLIVLGGGNAKAQMQFFLMLGQI